MSRRSWGTGSIRWVRGKAQARLPASLGRKPLGSFDTEEEAAAVLAAALEDLAQDGTPRGITLAQWGEQWLAAREASSDYRAVERERSRWKCYVRDALIAKLPVREITEQDVRAWVKGLRGTRKAKLEAQTRANALTLLRCCLEDAKTEAGLRADNPARDVRLPKGARARRKDTWTWLTADEIKNVLTCEAIPLRHRLLYQVAIYTGLRAGELWGLRWGDIDWQRRVLHVQRSYFDRPTKNGRPREVPLLEPAHGALCEWRKLYPACVRSRFEIVWPSPDEKSHASGYDAGWADHRTKARIRRSVRFHDLRHTCASHLLQGTWAPEWMERPLRLEEVRDWLGHTDIQVTQRYAHLCADAIRSVVKTAPAGPNSGHGLGTTDSHLRELNSRPTVYECAAGAADAASIEALLVIVPSLVPRLLEARDVFRQAVTAGDGKAIHRGLDLAELVDELEAAMPDTSAERAGGERG